MSKICSKCRRELDETNFNWKIKNVRLSVHCKDCSRRYIREHYKNNLEYYLAKARRRNLWVIARAHQYIGTYLLNHPCVDCGEKDILVLEFDHINRKDKDFDVGSVNRNGYPLKRLIAEISKCEVRCANCHRKKTVKEANSWKLKYAPVA